MLRCIACLIFLFFSLPFYAQWNVGQQAPNLIDVDVRTGDTVDLYADYLNKGRAVIIEVSAVWCSPCISFHQTQTLKQIYEAYGPGQTDEVAVIWVDGDGAESLDILTGNNDAQYDWTANSPYPMISNTGIPSNGYPAFYLICPDGIIQNSSFSPNFWRPAFDGIRGDLTGCGFPDDTKGNASIQVVSASADYCSSVGPTVYISTGSFYVSGQVVLNVNGEPYDSKAFDVSYSDDETYITFDPLEGVEAGAELEFIIQSADDNNPVDDTARHVFNPAPIISLQENESSFHFFLRPDVWGSQIQWEIRNFDGDLFASGGPYEDYATLEEDVWTYDTLRIESQEIQVESVEPGCYYLSIQDNAEIEVDGVIHYGNGIYDPDYPEFGYGYFELRTASGELVKHYPGNSYVKDRYFVFEVDRPLGVSERADESALELYPQPSAETLNVTWKNHSPSDQIFLYDLQGRLYHAQVVEMGQIQVDVRAYASGIYVLQLQSEDGVVSRRFEVLRP